MDGVTQNGILYLKGSTKPFTGKSLCIWDTANVTWYKGKYQDGLKEGLWIFYNKNSTKKSETNYSAGKMNGLRKVYNSRNQIAYTLNCIDNKCEHISQILTINEVFVYDDKSINRKFRGQDE